MKKKLEKLKNRYWKMKLKTQIKNKNCSILTKIKSQIDNNMTWLNHEFCVPTNIWYEDLALPPIFASQADSGGKLFRQKIIHFIESLPPLWDLDYFIFLEIHTQNALIFLSHFYPSGWKPRGVLLSWLRASVGRRRRRADFPLSLFFFAMAFPINAKIGTQTNLTAGNVIVWPDF